MEDSPRGPGPGVAVSRVGVWPMRGAARSLKEDYGAAEPRSGGRKVMGKFQPFHGEGFLRSPQNAAFP